MEERGSDRVQQILQEASSLAVSIICLPEIVSALCRRKRERRLSKRVYLEVKSAVLDDIEDVSIVNVTGYVVGRSVEILERWPLRSFDALHVASAAEWSAELFVSADARQCDAAREYGLNVELLRG